MTYSDIFNYNQMIESRASNPTKWNLGEGLILTHNLDKTISILSKSNAVVYHHAADRFTLKFSTSKYRSLQSTIVLANNLGWFPASIQPFPAQFDVRSRPFSEELLEEYIYDYDNILITFEAKFDIEVELPRYLYHITPKKNLNRILKYGLTPRADSSRRTYHPPRIYFADNQNTITDLAKYLEIEPVNSKSNQFKNRGSRVVLKIVTSGLPLYFKLYKDPNFKDKGFFTLHNIPPNQIKIVGEITD